MIGAILGAVGLAGLPDVKAERDAKRAADLAAAAAAEARELARLEQLQAAARNARREADAKIEAEHEAHERKLADAFAAEVFPALVAAIGSWADEPGRAKLPPLIKLVQAANARGVEQLGDLANVGGPVPTDWPALAFIARALPSRPDLYCVRNLRDTVHGLSSAVLRSALAGNAPGLESALFALEEQVEDFIAAHPRHAPESQHREAWTAITTSGRPSDRTARLAAIGARVAAAVAVDHAVAAQSQAQPAPVDDDETDEHFAADTAHFERLAAEMSAPRAVQSHRT